MEENEESEEHHEEKHHDVKTEETSLSLAQNENTFLLRRRASKHFTCPQCGKIFPYKLSLNDHMRIHTREKPHTASHKLLIRLDRG